MKRRVGAVLFVPFLAYFLTFEHASPLVLSIANFRIWHDSASFSPAHERLLSGESLPLDAGSAAIRSGAAAFITQLDRQEVTQSKLFDSDKN